MPGVHRALMLPPVDPQRGPLVVGAAEADPGPRHAVLVDVQQQAGLGVLVPGAGPHAVHTPAADLGNHCPVRPSGLTVMHGAQVQLLGHLVHSSPHSLVQAQVLPPQPTRRQGAHTGPQKPHTGQGHAPPPQGPLDLVPRPAGRLTAHPGGLGQVAHTQLGVAPPVQGLAGVHRQAPHQGAHGPPVLSVRAV